MGNFCWCKFSYIWPKSPQNKFSHVLISYTRVTRPHPHSSPMAHSTAQWSLSRFMASVSIVQLIKSLWVGHSDLHYAIHAHEVNYCNSCKGMKLEQSQVCWIIKHLCQSGSTSVDIWAISYWIELELREHKFHASESQIFYQETLTIKCTDMWKEVEVLMAKSSLSAEEEEEIPIIETYYSILWGKGVPWTAWLNLLSPKGLPQEKPAIYHVVWWKDWSKNTDHTVSII